jgi:hypothetical protein
MLAGYKPLPRRNFDHALTNERVGLTRRQKTPGCQK